MGNTTNSTIDYEITDNFLDSVDFAQVQSIFIDNFNLPWYYNNGIAQPEAASDIYKFQFTHTLFRENQGILSDSFQYIKPLIDKINPKVLIRVKANLGTVTPIHQEGGLHTDFDFLCRTAIFYLNDNNGYTLFEDKTQVESKANRFVSFSSHHIHTGVSQTDSKIRCLININYIPSNSENTLRENKKIKLVK